MSHWFASTLQTVRERSLDALEFVRKDLTDFSTTVKNDTETFLNKWTSQPKNESVKSNEDRVEKFHLPSAPIDRFQSEKFRLENDESTFLTDPQPAEHYQTWLKNSEFNVDARKTDITQLLIDVPHLRAQYSRLVPQSTSHNEFWSRYFFRLFQLEQDEHRRVEMLKRVEQMCNEESDQRRKSTDWDDPEDQSTQSHESDTISGDSWEKEFDENELRPQRTITTNSLSNSIISTATKVPENQLNEDEWESWS